jgi:cytochrome c-type biogenesis protein CcmE
MNHENVFRGAARALAFAIGLGIATTTPPAGAYQRIEWGELAPDEARAQPDHVAVRVLGRVRSLGTGARGFTLDAGGMSFQVEYVGRSGQPGFGVRPPTVREGDRVVVYGTMTGPGRLEAQRLEVVSSGGVPGRRLTGQVRSVDPGRDRLSVRTDDGSLTSVEYSPQTIVARLGRRASPDDIRTGDPVWVEGRWLDRDRLQATRIEITDTSGGWRDGDSGEIVSVNRGDSVLRVRFSSDVRPVDVRSADLIVDGRRANPDRLRAGTRVRVFGEERGSTIRARRVELLAEVDEDSRNQVVDGRVRSVDPGARIVVLTVPDSPRPTQRVYVTRDTRIERNGRRLDIREIQTGDTIRVRGATRDGQLEADFIEIR